MDKDRLRVGVVGNFNISRIIIMPEGIIFFTAVVPVAEFKSWVVVVLVLGLLAV